MNALLVIILRQYYLLILTEHSPAIKCLTSWTFGFRPIGTNEIAFILWYIREQVVHFYS